MKNNKIGNYRARLLFWQSAPNFLNTSFSKSALNKSPSNLQHTFQQLMNYFYRKKPSVKIQMLKVKKIGDLDQ